MTRWRSLAAAGLALLGACAPRGPRVPNVPVVVIPRDTVARPAPRDTVRVPAQPTQPAPDTAAFPEALLAPAVRVGLVVDSTSVRVGSGGEFTVSTQNGRQLARLGAGSTATFTERGGTLSFEGGGGTGGNNLPAPLVVRTVAPHGTLLVRGQPYRGEMLVQQAPGGGVTLVNRLDLETYLMGVVPREIGNVQADVFEAVKAQAVAARTYATIYMGRRSAQGFDVYATVEDQVYGGVAAEYALASRAVRETAGEILTYGGQPITAYYHSTCAGHTAAIDEVWNNAPVPYLVAVRDINPANGEAYDRVSSRFQWTERWTHDQLVTILNRTMADSLRGRRIGRIEDMRVTARTPSGRVRTMLLATDAGTFTLGKDRVRWILTPASRAGILNSSKFDVRLERSGGRVTQIVAEGGGWGHGIGMCQVGAMGRARAGQDYRTILRSYYPGTELRDQY